jgi:hypothetical protein
MEGRAIRVSVPRWPRTLRPPVARRIDATVAASRRMRLPAPSTALAVPERRRSTWRRSSPLPRRRTRPGGACRSGWRRPSGATSNAESSRSGSHEFDAATAGRSASWRSRTRGGGCARRATPGGWPRSRRTSRNHVLPHLPIRQWVLSLPKRLRPFLHRDPEMAGARARDLRSRPPRDSTTVEPDGPPGL